MALEDTYPALAPKIKTARGEGYGDEEIQSFVRGRIHEASREGYSPDEINKYLGSIKPPTPSLKSIAGDTLSSVAGAVQSVPSMVAKSLAPPRGLRESLRAGAENVNAFLLNQRGFDESLGRQYPRVTGALRSLSGVLPDTTASIESLRQIPEESRRLSRVLNPVFGRAGEAIAPYVAGARAAMSAPLNLITPKVAMETLAPALQTVSETAGKVSELAGLPKPITNLVKEFSPDAVMVALPVAYHRMFNRPPSSRADYIKAARTEPAFVETVKAEIERAAQGKEERPFVLGDVTKPVARQTKPPIGETLAPKPEPIAPPAEIVVPSPTVEPQATIIKPPRQRPQPTTDQSLAGFLTNSGGISIARSPKEAGELRARRQSTQGKRFIRAKEGLTLDEAAQRAQEAGFIEEPSARALLEALDNQIEGRPVFSTQGSMRERKIDLESERTIAEGDRIIMERAAEAKINEIRGEQPLEYKGHRFDKASEVPGGIRLEDDIDVTLTTADDILRVEKRAPSSRQFDQATLYPALKLEDGTVIRGERDKGHAPMYEGLSPEQQSRIVQSGWQDPDLSFDSPRNFFADSHQARIEFNRRNNVAGAETETPQPVRKIKTAEGLKEVPAEQTVAGSAKDAIAKLDARALESEGKGGFDINAERRFRERFAKPLARSLEKTPWRTVKDISQSTQPFNRTQRGDSAVLNAMKVLEGSVEQAYLEDGTPVYALKGTPRPKEVYSTAEWQEKFEPTRPPTFQQTEAGMQGVIPGAEGRSIPNAPLRPKRAQTEKPMDLEQPGIRAKEPELFGKQTDKPVPVPREQLTAEEVAAADEMRGMLRAKRPKTTVPDEVPFDVPEAGGDIEPGSYGMPAPRKTAYIRRTGNTIQTTADIMPGTLVYDHLLGRGGEITKIFKDSVELAEGNERWTARIGNRLEVAELVKAESPIRPRRQRPAPITEAEAMSGAYGFPEFRKGPKGVPQTVSPLDRNFKPPTLPIGDQPIVRRGDIIRDMQDAFQVPIRSGHGNFAQMKASGFFKVKEEVIRLKKANDMEVVAHEIGHFISKKFFNYDYSKGKGRKQPFHGELDRLGKDLYGNRKPHGGYAEEGIAEFIRFYVVDPAKAKAKAPKFFDFFENQIVTKFPDMGDTLHQARENWKRYQEQPAVARVLSQISVGEDRPRSFTLSDLYKHTLDDLEPIRLFTKRMSEGREPIRASDNPYTLARLFRGWVGKADLFLKDGPIDFETLRPVERANPLNEILKPFAKNLDDLRGYLVARRAAELMSRGKETGLASADVQATLDAYNSRPEFVRAAEQLQSYNNALLDYLQKSGVLGAEAAAKIKELNQQYVPFYRLIEGETKGAGVAGTQRFGNLGSPVKRIKGSAREIVDPLESIVKNTYAMINVAERNQVGQALVRLSKTGQGMGKYIEEVPRSKIPVTLKDEDLHNVLARYGRMKQTETFKTSKQEFTRESGIGDEAGQPTTKGQQLVEIRVKEALTARGFSEGEAKLYIDRLKSAKTETQINSIIEKIVTEQTIKTVTKELELDLPPQVIAAFRPDPKVPGMDNIITVRQDGKPILYQVHPELYESMAGLNKNASNMLIRILSLPARALRLGATTLSPEFAVRNPVRDQWSAAIYSRYGYVPGVDFMRGLAHMIKNDELYQAWKAGGGEGSMLVSMDRTSLQKTLKDVLRSGQAKHLAGTVIAHPIESLRMLSELSESATRVGEFAKGISKEGGFSKENILKSAMASREVTLDFARMGATMKATGANQIVAFLNSNLQGLDKMARAFKERPGPTMAKAVATITVPSLMLYVANHDDPRYQELPEWQRDLFWIIPSGSMDTATWSKMSPTEKTKFNRQHTIWRIPKPFELGILFGTFPERMLDWTLKNDPQAFAEFAKSAMNSLPNPIPTAALPLIENMANYSMFRERPIVPRGKEDVAPPMQYTPATSETAKVMGRAVNYSPAKIDNLIQGWLGATGRLALDVGDLGLKEQKGEKPEKVTADIPVVRAFAARFPGQPESIERFYEKYQKAQEAKATVDALKREGKLDQANEYIKEHRAEIAAATRYRQIAQNFSQLRKLQDRIKNDPKVSAEAKRTRMDALTFRMTAIARRAIGKVDREEEMPKTGTEE